VQNYVLSLIDQMPWPATMTGLPSLAAYVKPPDPNVESEIPTAYIWFQRGREDRDSDRLRAGTVPRISFPGGPSGTKAVTHQVPVWLVWMMDTDDPDASTLFPGMVWAIQQVFRSAAAAFNGQVAANPYKMTDPWTEDQSWLIDIGEVMTYDTDLRTLANQRFLRLDALIELTLVEVIAS
jgi:hypothetical protein